MGEMEGQKQDWPFVSQREESYQKAGHDHPHSIAKVQ